MTTEKQLTPLIGRPREAEVQRRIISATLKLMDQAGFVEMSIDSVAREAKVSKRSIYLRYANKAELAIAALASAWNTTEAPDTGSTYGDLAALLNQGQQNVSSPAGASLIGYLIADASRSKTAIEQFGQLVTGPRRRLYARVLRRGIERKEVRSDIDIPFVVDLLRGPYYARVLSNLPIPCDFQDKVVESVWQFIKT